MEFAELAVTDSSGKRMECRLKPDDVGGLLFKMRVVGCHVTIQPVWLQACLRPDALHTGLAQTQFRRHLAARPVRGPVAGLLLRFPHDLGQHGGVSHTGLAALMAIETSDAVFFEALLPPAQLVALRVGNRKQWLNSVS